MKHLTSMLLLVAVAGCAIGSASLVESMKTNGDVIIPEAIAMYEGGAAPANGAARIAQLADWKDDIRKLKDEAETAAEKQFAERMHRPSRIFFPELEKLYAGQNLNLDADQVKRRVRTLKEWHQTIKTANE